MVPNIDDVINLDSLLNSIILEIDANEHIQRMIADLPFSLEPHLSFDPLRIYFELPDLVGLYDRNFVYLPNDHFRRLSEQTLELSRELARIVENRGLYRVSSNGLGTGGLGIGVLAFGDDPGERYDP